MALPVGKIAPFDGAPGVWLRCAFHAHTTESDGWYTPPMLRRYYTLGGFDVLAITDHDKLTATPEGADEMLVIGGALINLGPPQFGGPRPRPRTRRPSTPQL